MAFFQQGLIVQKYGGTSLHTPKHVRRAAEEIAKLHQKGMQLVVVVSAMGHMTDHLIRLAEKTVAKPNRREMDMLLTAGERVSMSLLAMALSELNIPAISFTGSQSGIITNEQHTFAQIVEIRPTRILQALEHGKVVIVAGFQGVSREKEITTLGRGGSDTTAVALAATLKAEYTEILTDVNGLFTADPRIVKDAKPITTLSFEEALEMSHLGAKMHPRSMELAYKHQMPLWIHELQSNTGGTWIKNGEHKMEKPNITSITCRDGFQVARIDGTLKQLDEIHFFDHHSCGFIVSQPNSVCVAFLANDANDHCRSLADVGINFELLEHSSCVSVVGTGIHRDGAILSKILKLAEPYSIQLLSTSSLALSIFIPAKNKAALTRDLHRLID